eukprot:1363970-Amorphochlora_amoeboformis.AAC.1
MVDVAQCMAQGGEMSVGNTWQDVFTPKTGENERETSSINFRVVVFQGYLCDIHPFHVAGAHRLLVSDHAHDKYENGKCNRITAGKAYHLKLGLHAGASNHKDGVDAARVRLENAKNIERALETRRDENLLFRLPVVAAWYQCMFSLPYTI